MTDFFDVLYHVLSTSDDVNLTGHAWGSSVYCRNLPISDTWNSYISKGALHSSGNFGSLQMILCFHTIFTFFLDRVVLKDGPIGSWVILWEASKLMQLGVGVTCMGLVLLLLC